MSEEKVTVFMPVFNAEKTLKEAIESILNQTYSNFEFLIIDDGSTDSSVKIVQSYTDPRIRFYKNEKNLGVVQTANKGIDLATTELMARMDADDISFPERLEKQTQYFKQHPNCALLATWAKETNENNELIRIERIDPSFYYYNLTFECWIYHPSVMFKRSAVIDVGKYQYPHSEDYDLWWRLTRKNELYVLPEVLLNYKTSHNSISRVTVKKEYEDAHLQQMIRNIHYYTGPQFNIEDYEAEFLRSNLDPVFEKGVKELEGSFKKLDTINDFIIKKEKSRHEQIKKSAFFKKRRLVYFLSQYMKPRSIIKLLIRLSYCRLLALFTRQLIIKRAQKLTKKNVCFSF